MKNDMKKLLALIVASAAMSTAGRAEVIYDNFTTQLGAANTSVANEYGDQVNLAGYAWNRYVTEIRMEYYLSANATGSEKLELKLYDNPSGGAPGNLLWDSGAFSIAKGYNTVIADGLGINVPSSVTLTATFTGVTGTVSAGWDMYNPPTIGNSADDFWEKTSSGWTTKRFSTTGGPIANFGMQITAIPEPGTIQLGIMGGLALLGYLGYRRRSS